MKTKFGDPGIVCGKVCRLKQTLKVAVDSWSDNSEYELLICIYLLFFCSVANYNFYHIHCKWH